MSVVGTLPDIPMVYAGLAKWMSCVLYLLLHTQYAQYRMSRENMELINHKYHDLKHQIAVLRKESDLDKREAYLDEIEQGRLVFPAGADAGREKDVIGKARGKV